MKSRATIKCQLLWLKTLLILCLTIGCDNAPTLAGKWQYREVSRTISPDKLVEAILVDGDAGATTSTVYSLYLVPAGTALDLKQERDHCVFAADHIKGLEIAWKQPRLLEIGYDEARIYQFMNFWEGSEVRDERYVVEIRLAPTAPEYSLPLGDKTW